MLEWQPDAVGTGARSLCGRYSVAPAIDGSEKFVAYRLAPQGAWFAPLARATSLDEAKSAAEQDASGKCKHGIPRRFCTGVHD